MCSLHRPCSAYYADNATVECPSVYLSNQSTVAAACGGFAAERRAGGRYRMTAAGARSPAATAPQHDAQQQMRAVPRWQLT